MSVFADTSGLYALLFEPEEGHADVVRVFRDTLTGDRPLWTTSYVLVETIALLQSRVGLEPVRDFDEHVLPMLLVEWVSESLHRRGARRVLEESCRRLSLVDCVSFEFMHEKGIEDVLGLDRHFEEAGYRLLVK